MPGHVATFAYLQNLYHRGEVGFEASVLTMNTRAAALSEGGRIRSHARAAQSRHRTSAFHKQATRTRDACGDRIAVHDHRIQHDR